MQTQSDSGSNGSEGCFSEAMFGARLIHEHARVAIDILSAEAERHDAREIGETLLKLAAELDNDRFAVLVSGRFNSGKSTLLNALLGELETAVDIDSKLGVLPVGRFPTTAVLTDITYSASPFVRVWYKTGEYVEWTLHRFFNEGKVKRNETETRQFFDPIRQFEVGLPSLLLKSGVMLSDSPGMSDVPDREEITRDALLSSDAAIVVFRSDSGGGLDERKFADEVRDSGCRVFTLINLFPDSDSRANALIDDDSDMLRFWWNRLVDDRDSLPTIEEFAEKDIFFCDARKASVSRSERNSIETGASGLPRFESALAKFLKTERLGAHVNKSLRETERCADALQRSISTLQYARRMSVDDLQKVIAALEPQLKLLESQREQLHQVILRYETEVVLEGRAAFQTFVKHLGTTLETKLLDKSIEWRTLGAGTLAKSLFSQGAKDAIAQEILAKIQDIIRVELKQWADAVPPTLGLRAALDPVFKRMAQDIDSRIRKLDDTLREFGQKIPNREVGQSFGKMTGLADMIAVHLNAEGNRHAAVGVAVGGVLAATLVATIGGKLAFAIGFAIFSALGVALNPLLILGFLVAAIVAGAGTFGSMSVSSVIKKKAAEATVHHLMSSLETADEFQNSVRKTYIAVTSPIRAIVDQAIQAEAEQLRVLKGSKNQQAACVRRELGELDIALDRILAARDAIAEARNMVAQVS